MRRMLDSPSGVLLSRLEALATGNAVTVRATTRCLTENIH